MRIYLGSLGCKLNQAEIEALAERLAQAGHEIVACPAEADACILNTCAVTGVAAQKSRQALRRLHRESPAARLIVTGCYAELAQAELREVPGVERVVGNADKESLARLLGVGGADRLPILPPERRTRPLIKIQDGCDNACTYCIIRVARGPQRSRPADEVLEEVRAHRAAGCHEIVLTGVHIGAYGRDRGGPELGPDLWGLAARILDETDLPRLRLSSIEPWDLPERALRLWQDPRLCPHLHLPLQSGCDATLRRMGRRYTAAGFSALVSVARAAIPDLAVTTDLIVGFPGETEEEFGQSLACVQAIGFARTHVFPFSARPGTPAVAMPGQVPAAVREGRARLMRAAGATAEQAFRQQFVGRTLEVLWEAGPGPAWSGLTGNYLRVHTAGAADLHNRITPTRLTALAPGGLWGEVEVGALGRES